MPYISSDGHVGERKEWSLATIPDFFWGFINFIGLFFRTFINPGEASHGNSQTGFYGPSGRRPPPGPSRRRLGRISHGGDDGVPPMMGGG
ncbi:selenoprotein K-like [Portunus trituberculatus]|uniref:selenoprotein K-like n=1 Tax=Portunus trituberculatus TaxID=210409 RepID=UPI001E1CB214|nr:selenoprotein K-like [Portunus trituberculatus]